MHGALNYRVMAIFCPEYKTLLRNMKLQCLKLFIMTKTEKKIFWRISVKFHLWVPLNYHNFVHCENTISEHMAIFKENICKLFKYL